MRQSMLAFVLALHALSATAEGTWPDRIVAIEDMKWDTRMHISVPASRPRGEVKRPVTLRVHVDAEGAVRRVVLVESSGSPGHDSATVRAMKEQRFKPFLVDGTPTEVTLVVPLNLPKSDATGG